MLLSTMEVQGESGDWFPRIASGFGGGIGRAGLVCGAVIGAIIAAGWHFGRDSADYDRDKLYEISRSLVRSFEARFGAVNCRNLINYDLSNHQEMLKALDSGVFNEKCPNFVEFCAIEIMYDLPH